MQRPVRIIGASAFERARAHARWIVRGIRRPSVVACLIVVAIVGGLASVIVLHDIAPAPQKLVDPGPPPSWPTDRPQSPPGPVPFSRSAIVQPVLRKIVVPGP